VVVCCEYGSDFFLGGGVHNTLDIPLTILENSSLSWTLFHVVRQAET
jgi:hypothetical protein